MSKGKKIGQLRLLVVLVINEGRTMIEGSGWEDRLSLGKDV